jgi:hypothetical protein
MRPPSPALVLSLIALFVSLGGVSYGLATGSINSREIKNDTIRSKDIHDGAVRGKDVNNDSLTNKDIDNSELEAARADLADDSNHLGGLRPSAFLRSRTRVFDTRLRPDVIDYTGNAVLAALSLPAGEFLVQGRVSLENDAATASGFTCTLSVPGTRDDQLTKLLGVGGTDIDQRTYTLQAGFKSSAASTVSIRCNQRIATPDLNDARDARITAVLLN